MQVHRAYIPGMTTDAETMIVPNDFPELKGLVWNRDPARDACLGGFRAV